MPKRESFSVQSQYEDRHSDRDSSSREKAPILPLSISDTKKEVVLEGNSVYAASMSLLMYSVFSVSMVLSNKAIGYTVDPSLRSKMPQISVVLYQNVLAVVLVEVAKYLKFIDYPDFQLSVAYAWLPMNALFVSMLCSGFLALFYVNVPMVQTFKNLTNIITVFGDWYFFGETVTPLSIISIFIMTIGAVFAGVNDLQFSIVGYFWMTMNCLSTAAYTLYMRYASRNIKIPRMGMIFYNNTLSVIFLLPMIFLCGEIPSLMDPNIMSIKFISMNTLAGMLGAGLNFASLWCVSATSATTYAIVGTLNKIPVTILGFTLFDTAVTQEGLIFIGMASVGGILYGWSKLPKRK